MNIVGLLLLTPLAWVIISSAIWSSQGKPKEGSQKDDSIQVFALILVLAIWGVLILSGLVK